MPLLNFSKCLRPTTCFSERPIGTVETLARMLQTPVNDLKEIASQANSLYYVAAAIPKADGTFRECFDALPPLKSIHGRIQAMMLKKVAYPFYLHGGIKDEKFRRGQAFNASIHVKPKSLITLDIERFFPSIRQNVVYDVWHEFFRFPPLVATCLTNLTTLDGVLPQGAKTSPLLANLVFWDLEWKLALELYEADFIYTRLTDDISISSKIRLEKKSISHCIELIHGMCVKKGLQLNRQKQSIVHAGSPMVVTKLLVNERIAIPPKVRSSIRSSAHHVLHTPESERRSFEFVRKHQRTMGQISYLKQHHPNLADPLRLALKAAEPVRDELDD